MSQDSNGKHVELVNYPATKMSQEALWHILLEMPGEFKAERWSYNDGSGETAEMPIEQFNQMKALLAVRDARIKELEDENKVLSINEACAHGNWCDESEDHKDTKAKLARATAGAESRQGEIDKLKTEIQEQCRINGMGAQREAKLIAQLKEMSDNCISRGLHDSRVDAAERELKQVQDSHERQRDLNDRQWIKYQALEALGKEMAKAIDILLHFTSTDYSGAYHRLSNVFQKWEKR